MKGLSLCTLDYKPLARIIWILAISYNPNASVIHQSGIINFIIIVGSLRLELRITGPKSVVLPLH